MYRSSANSFELFLSTPSARRATGDSKTKGGNRFISIHALREEGDGSRAALRHGNTKFLSTPSARRATVLFNHDRDQVIDFYPRPPRGGRQLAESVPLTAADISIHALREEGDATARP